MPSTFTPNLRIELQATGENTNTWGTIANTNFGSLLEQAISGYVSIAMSDANLTLSTSQGASDQARNMFVRLTGTLSTTRDVIVPQVSKIYGVKNDTTQSVVVKMPTGTGVTLLSGSPWTLLMSDGTNIQALSITGNIIDKA